MPPYILILGEVVFAFLKTGVENQQFSLHFSICCSLMGISFTEPFPFIPTNIQTKTGGKRKYDRSI